MKEILIRLVIDISLAVLFVFIFQPPILSLLEMLGFTPDTTDLYLSLASSVGILSLVYQYQDLFHIGYTLQ